MGIEDNYTAFCFDECCLYIKQRLEDGEEPVFKNSYKSFRDMYKQYEK